MSYKYTMNPSSQKFTIFILYCIYIFRATLYGILLYFFFIKRYLFKYQRIPISTKLATFAC